MVELNIEMLHTLLRTFLLLPLLFYLLFQMPLLMLLYHDYE